MGRFLAICGWLARLVRRPFRRTRLGRLAMAPIALVVALLLELAALPIVLPLLDAQPADIGVEQIYDSAVTVPGTWVRIQGRLFPLDEEPTGVEGSFGLLVDAERRLRSIVVRGVEPFPPVDPEAVEVVTYSGRLAATGEVTVDLDALPIEATEAGTPPRVVPNRIIVLDAVTKPERQIWWPLSILPALLAGMILVGARTGYPVFRESKEIDVLTAPLGIGERLPAAWAGRVGPNQANLEDPGGALLLVRRGPAGSLLTAQPLADEGRLAPAPVTIGGGWSAGRIGWVHTINESVPALMIRSELVDATFLFARTTERDRVAALVTIKR